MTFLGSCAWIVLAIIFVPYLLHHALLGLYKGRDLKKRYGAEWALVTGASSGAPLLLVVLLLSVAPLLVCVFGRSARIAQHMSEQLVGIPNPAAGDNGWPNAASHCLPHVPHSRCTRHLRIST